jgi:hypothetical protein
MISFDRSLEYVGAASPDGLYLQAEKPDCGNAYQVVVIGPMPYTPRAIADEVELLVGAKLRVEEIAAMTAVSEEKAEIVRDRGFWRIVLRRDR